MNPLPISYKLSSSKGFTLVEILVVTGLFILLISVGAIIGFDSITRSTVHNERDLVVLMLTGARARALANVDQKPQGVHIETGKIVLYEGSVYNPADPTNRDTPRNTNITISPNPAEIIFDQLSANVTTGAGTITLMQDAQTDTVEINGQGRIEW